MSILKKTGAFIKWHSPLLIAGAVILLCLILFPGLSSFRHLRNILYESASPVILACGLSICLSAAYLDLSAAHNAVFSSICAGVLLQSSHLSDRILGSFPELPWILPLFVALILGACAALLPIAVSSRFRISPLFLSILTASLVQGISILISSGFTGSPKDITGFGEDYILFGTAYLGVDPVHSLPWVVIIAGLAVAGSWYFTSYSRTGITLKYAAPGVSGPYDLPLNADPADVSHKKQRLSTLASSLTVPALIAGALYGLSGFVEGARLGSISVQSAPAYWVTAFSGCLIGGMSVFGGRGSAPRAAAGTVICVALEYVFSFANVPPGISLLLTAFLASAALCLDVIKRRGILGARDAQAESSPRLQTVSEKPEGASHSKPGPEQVSDVHAPLDEQPERPEAKGVQGQSAKKRSVQKEKQAKFPAPEKAERAVSDAPVSKEEVKREAQAAEGKAAEADTSGKEKKEGGSRWKLDASFFSEDKKTDKNSSAD